MDSETMKAMIEAKKQESKRLLILVRRLMNAVDSLEGVEMPYLLARNLAYANNNVRDFLDRVESDTKPAV